MKLTYDIRTWPGITLDRPLTNDELVERVYREGQRLCGFVQLPLARLMGTRGFFAAEAEVVSAFIGEAGYYPETVRIWPSDRSNANGLVLFVELRVNIDSLGVDWDHIDDTADPDVPEMETRSFHHHVGHPVEMDGDHRFPSV